MTLPALYDHQEYTADFIVKNAAVFITSDAGTGKTRSVLEGFVRLRETLQTRLLVIAPLSILEPAWGDDIKRWTPQLTYGFSTSGSDKKRTAAFVDPTVDVVITNHDAVKWLLENPKYLDGFHMVAIDESSAFKHRTSARSKAIRALMKKFSRRILMSATPTSKTICDIWHQALLLDNGARLGAMFFGFRQQVTTPIQAGPRPEMVVWVDKEGASDIVAERLRDITVRFKLEDCLDLPPTVQYTRQVVLPAKLMAQYRQLESEAVVTIRDTKINAIHAASKFQKLLQLCSGAVYDGDHVAHVFDTARYELVTQLVLERPHSIVVFNWKHQRDELLRLANTAEISYAVIDGDTPHNQRADIVRDYQAGKYRAIYVHPKSAGHGLTLTKATTTIWASPTNNAEWFVQTNARMYRAGQTERTETILIAAADTKEPLVYEKMLQKKDNMFSLLDIFGGSTKGEIAMAS
jgi:SNF2 family DNA or RNA helicase